MKIIGKKEYKIHLFWAMISLVFHQTQVLYDKSMWSKINNFQE